MKSLTLLQDKIYKPFFSTFDTFLSFIPAILNVPANVNFTVTIMPSQVQFFDFEARSLDDHRCPLLRDVSVFDLPSKESFEMRFRYNSYLFFAKFEKL